MSINNNSINNSVGPVNNGLKGCYTPKNRMRVHGFCQRVTREKYHGESLEKLLQLSDKAFGLKATVATWIRKGWSNMAKDCLALQERLEGCHAVINSLIDERLTREVPEEGPAQNNKRKAERSHEPVHVHKKRKTDVEHRERDNAHLRGEVNNGHLRGEVNNAANRSDNVILPPESTDEMRAVRETRERFLEAVARADATTEEGKLLLAYKEYYEILKQHWLSYGRHRSPESSFSPEFGRDLVKMLADETMWFSPLPEDWFRPLPGYEGFTRALNSILPDSTSIHGKENIVMSGFMKRTPDEIDQILGVDTNGRKG